ncbi:MAG: hypothetical protein ACJAZM_001828 [Cyclobacteriaceae bacterium]|jgi:thiamine pyrophosphokinase
MSSHHIVRDEQEPALLVLDLQSFATEMLGLLLEWSPTVMCGEVGFEQLVQRGIKVDVAIVSESFVESNQEALSLQSPIVVIPSEAKSVLGVGLNHLKRGDHRSVNIVSEVSPESVFHDLEHDSHGLDVTIWKGNERHTRVSKGRFQKWLPKGAIFRSYGLAKNTEITVVQLDENPTVLAHEAWITVAKEGIVRLSSRENSFIYVEQMG